MSTAVLMNETWKPTVIQLVPFANNKMRTTTGKDKPYSDQSRAGTQKRSFPVLAVTRTYSGNSSKHDRISPNINSASHHKKLANDTDSNVYGVKRPVKRTVKQDSNVCNENEYDANNNTLDYNGHADSMMFSARDLNDQTQGSQTNNSNGIPTLNINGSHSRRTSATSTDSRASEHSPSETVGHRVLPKPSIGSARYFLSQQGKNIVKPTPGEIELQKYKNNYAREQAQKRSKYKLNVNQLPRSTTPINDNDPDKLNMKQVIQFLQNQKSSVKSPKSHVQMNKSSEKKMFLDTYGPPRNGAINHSPPDCAKYDQQLFEKIVMHEPSQKHARGSAVSRVSNTTALSTKSTPILTHNQDKNSDISKSSSTAKSMIERSHRVKRSDKRVKEFKLYRFLAVMPGNETKKSPVVFSATESAVEKKDFVPVRSRKEKVVILPKEDEEPEIKYRTSLVRDCIDSARQNCSENSVESETDNQLEYRSDRAKVTRTANVVHRKAKKHQLKLEQEGNHKNGPDSDLEDAKHDSTNSCGMIRLPNMDDFQEEDQCSEEQDEDSVVLRSVYKANNNVMLDQPEPETQTHHVSLCMDTNCHTGFTPNPAFRGMTRAHKKKNTASDNSHSQRKLTISIPDENTDEADVIKLTLRKEKNATRETSYMTDMAGRHENLGIVYSSLNGTMGMSENYFDRNVIRISTVSMQQRSGKCSDDPASNASTSMAKSCIKVRQKLKAHMSKISQSKLLAYLFYRNFTTKLSRSQERWARFFEECTCTPYPDYHLSLSKCQHLHFRKDKNNVKDVQLSRDIVVPVVISKYTGGRNKHVVPRELVVYAQKIATIPNTEVQGMERAIIQQSLQP